MKILLLSATLFLGVLSSLPLHATGRDRARFDDGWKFHLLDSAVPEPPGVPSAGTPVASWRWRTAANPAAETADISRADFDDHAWAQVASAHELLRQEHASAWFRATLPALASPAPRLHFEGVDDLGTVYLNGQRLAHHAGWQDPFDVPLAPAWRPDGPNVLVVLVENVGGAGGLDPVYLQTTAPPAPAVITDGPAAAAYDDHAWRDVQLPHDFVVEGTFDPHGDASHGFLPKGAGWYRKTFPLSADDRGKVLWLEFDGVYRDSLVWLNGHLLGRHASGYTSFYYDATAFANCGGQNVLTVWADARHNEGWWYEGGGIYRHVYLTKLDPLHFAHWGTQVSTRLPADLSWAMIDTAVDVENDGSAQSADLEYELIGPDGRTVQTLHDMKNASFHPGRSDGIGAWFKMGQPALWSPENPELYSLRCTLRRGDQVLDEVTTRFGVRTLRWDENHGFFLNGQPYKIQGTCNHQDFAGLGVALPDHVHSYKVALLKEMGCNAFRFSHQPMAPELLDACDEQGLLVMDENRRLGDSDEVLGQVESLVRRDRNHPSVFLWSMCNEESLQGTPEGARMFAAMKAVVLRWDRSRPVTSAMNGGFGAGDSLVEDLQGFNYNTGAYDGFHAKFPGLPCYGSETASETTTRGVYLDDRDKGYVGTLRTTAEDAWKPLAERPWMAGGFVWTGFDYRGEPSPYQWPDVNSNFGFMDTCGFPKDGYYYYRSQWIDQPAAHILQQWNRPGQEGREIPVWVTGNAARYELFLNGTSLGVKDLPAHLHAEWKVPYAPGVLEARGYDAAGKLVASDKLETTGEPARLDLAPDRPAFAADREDVVLVRCTVTDAAGRVVPTADNEVIFAVEGPAKVAGVGNGNPSDHDPDRASRRHAFNGRCLAVVQAQDKTGTVTLTATSPGLPPASLTLQAR